MSGFRPASLTACPPREPPPLFEQEHRNPKELVNRRRRRRLANRALECENRVRESRPSFALTPTKRIGRLLLVVRHRVGWPLNAEPAAATKGL